MLQRPNPPRAGCGFGLATLSLWLALAPTVSVAQGRSPAYDSSEAMLAERISTEAVMPSDWGVSRFETSSVIAAALCFAVGFVACLLIVHHMLPSLVQVQCVEIVRDYLEHVPRASDIRVVFVDRESQESLRRPRRAGVPAAQTNAASSYDLPQDLRVDQPATPTGSADGHGDNAPKSMLSQIYEQNLLLRDQLRKQSRSVKQ